MQFADLVEKHSNKLAALETWDSGKPHEQADKDELLMSVSLMHYYASWADKIQSLVVYVDSAHHLQILHEAIRVTCQIIPWNFLLLILAWKVDSSLACGSTVILKTAKQTPLTALYAVKLFHKMSILDLITHLVLVGSYFNIAFYVSCISGCGFVAFVTCRLCIELQIFLLAFRMLNKGIVAGKVVGQLGSIERVGIDLIQAVPISGLHGLELAYSSQLVPFCLESDCQVLISKIARHGPDLSI
ncbi:hypothetical protein M9H77_18820 [Catharanthus roseus]|uniref:Uncharacterized protein n=1 Tax=Catharanthus roseus TaxID=4058 RepID=A0ACC0B8M7_CATRO|nr:hypothetical protein M9H77_18820 [Catharanthus roseus]